MQLFIFQNLPTNKLIFCFSEENDCIKQYECYIILKKLAFFRYGRKISKTAGDYGYHSFNV